MMLHIRLNQIMFEDTIFVNLSQKIVTVSHNLYLKLQILQKVLIQQYVEKNYV